MVGDVLVKDVNGVKWNSESLSAGYMRYDQYDQDRTGTVNSARQANNAATVDGHTVARNVLADEYTNEQIDESFESVREEISDLDSVAVKSVNSIQPDQNGNVQLSKADIGLGNVDNTTDIDKPISSAAQEALDQKVDKAPGMGLSQNSFTDTEKEKLEGIEAGAEVNVQANWDQTVPTADDYIQNKPSIPENTSDLVNDSGFITAALAPVQGVKGSAESAYRTGNVSISKANIGLGNVDNTSDVNKPISTATQSALDKKVDKVSGKGLSTNDFTNAEKTKLADIEAGAQVNTITGVKGDAETDYRTGNVNITKENIGLGNVDNTSDLDKPISTATQAALDDKQATLTFDTTPTAGSTNPVTSDGIATEISALNSNLNQKVSSVNGETPDTNGNVEIDATDIETSSGVAIKSVNGNPVTIADALQGNALGVNTTLEPIQDLHGYDHPWAGGAGKNLLKYPYYQTTRTENGVTFTDNGDGSITINGTSTAATDFLIIANSVHMPIANGSYKWVLLGSSENNDVYLHMRTNAGDDYINTAVGESMPVTVDQNIIYSGVLRVRSGKTINGLTVYPMLILASETDAPFEPYSNICPISGRTQVEISNKDSEDVEQASVTVDLGQTVYGGTLNVTTGELTVETANIESYNGESIGEPWWSSMDEYVAGTTPTTGAQVVYTLATPQTIQLTPAQINLLTGTNIISTNADYLSVRYYATGQTGNVEGNIAFLLDKTASNETEVNAVSESIAPIETGTATQNYATGSYLMLNNRLCKVTAAIATGEQIIVGSNVQYTTVAEELMAILAQINA
jgi:hypothetical protein